VHERQVGLLHPGPRTIVDVVPFSRELAVRQQAGGDAAVGQRRADVYRFSGCGWGSGLRRTAFGAEDRRRGADAERERRDGGEGKAARAGSRNANRRS
jgi:hypothetical protein